MGKKSGIPTMYKGVQYRSRLEAKWAAMFDALGWKFQYEPFDLPGWIPDFALMGCKPVLVEVKPFFTLEQFRSEGTIAQDLRAMKGSACEDSEVLLLGATLGEDVSHQGGEAFKSVVLGWLGSITGEFGNAILVRNNPDHPLERLYDFVPERGSPEGHVHPELNGERQWSGVVGPVEANAFWAKCGNTTQWEKPKPRSRSSYRKRQRPTVLYQDLDLEDCIEQTRLEALNKQEEERIVACERREREAQYEAGTVCYWRCGACNAHGKGGTLKTFQASNGMFDESYPLCDKCGSKDIEYEYGNGYTEDFGAERREKEEIAATTWVCRDCEAGGRGGSPFYSKEKTCRACKSENITINHPRLGVLEYPLQPEEVDTDYYDDMAEYLDMEDFEV